jgi:hypothetical protein
VRVAHRRVEEDTADQCQDGVANPAVGPRHGAGLDSAHEAVAHDEVAAVAQLFDQRRNRREVVAVVGVAHDHEAAARRVDAADQRAAVALPRDLDHARAQLSGDHL